MAALTSGAAAVTSCFLLKKKLIIKNHAYNNIIYDYHRLRMSLQKCMKEFILMAPFLRLSDYNNYS